MSLVNSSEALQAIKESPKWIFFGRNNSQPRLRTIAVGDARTVFCEHAADAHRVFEALELNLETLSEIFSDAPDGPGYAGLGFCVVGDHARWCRLAVLTNKTIYFALASGSESGGPVKFVYLPDGTHREIVRDEHGKMLNDNA